MRDIDQKKYKERKELEYDDDIAVLFYKGEKVIKTRAESFTNSWVEEASYFGTIAELLDDMGCEIPHDFDDADNEDKWEHIWDELAWDDSSKSYKYSNWEMVVLDL